MKKRTLITIIAIFITTFVMFSVTKVVLAETSGNSPESGATSRIKTLYISLVNLGHGADTSSYWGSWGYMWNRIRSASEWRPSGNATAADVLAGKTFYSNSRTLQTGTLSFTGTATASDVMAGKTFYSNSTTLITGTGSVAMNYALQQYNSFDDYEGRDAPLDYQGDESAWTNTATNVWRDGRTQLYWSNVLGTYTNEALSLERSYCTFWLSDPRGSYDGSDSNCGNAINACATLSLDATGDGIAETDWYLPTNKELQQAYIDGIVNQTGETFVTDSQLWASTEDGEDATFAYTFQLQKGIGSFERESDTYSIVCVRR